ncbi:MAG: hypothetical protein AAGF95_06415 [Chloroflexota bacterium]
MRAGLALYNHDGRLVWYRSHNFGSTTRLRRGVYSLLNDIPHLAWIILEGGGNIADIWLKEAARRKLGIHQINAETWRERFLYSREQRSGQQAKNHADQFARRIITWSSATNPTSLRHDAAEAIAIGMWGVLEVGWLEQLPSAVRR